MAIAIDQQFASQRLGVNLRAAIQSTGKLSFTEKTIEAVQFTAETAFAIYPDSDSKEVLYLKKTTQAEDAKSFAVKKSGKYWYMNTKTLFTSLGLPFREKTIIFDMHRAMNLEEEMGGEWYELVMRTIEHDTEEEE